MPVPNSAFEVFFWLVVLKIYNSDFSFFGTGVISKNGCWSNGLDQSVLFTVYI